MSILTRERRSGAPYNAAYLTFQVFAGALLFVRFGLSLLADQHRARFACVAITILGAALPLALRSRSLGSHSIPSSFRSALPPVRAWATWSSGMRARLASCYCPPHPIPHPMWHPPRGHEPTNVCDPTHRAWLVVKDRHPCFRPRLLLPHLGGTAAKACRCCACVNSLGGC